jgi:hypothetical protein
MKKFLTTALLCGILGALIVGGCSKAINDKKGYDAALRAETAAELTLPLTEKEKDYWIAVYTAAVRRGTFYPAQYANSAIIELRKASGEQK